MPRPLIRGDVTIESLDELLGEKGISSGEKDLIQNIKNLVSCIPPQRAIIRNYEEKRSSIAEELKTGRFNSIQRRIRSDAVKIITNNIRTNKKKFDGDLKAIEGNLSLLRRLRKIRGQFRPAEANPEWYVWLPEPPPRTEKNKRGITAGFVGAAISFGALTVPIALFLPPIWLIAAFSGGAILSAGLVGSGYGYGYAPFKLFWEMIPAENLEAYEKAKTSNLFDVFVVATPGKDFSECASHVLFGIVGELAFRPISRQVKDSYSPLGYHDEVVGYEAQIKDVKGHLFEITRWRKESHPSKK